MKKILFSLVALVCSMSMNAQIMKVMKGKTVVATYKSSQADKVVFEEYVDPFLPGVFSVSADKKVNFTKSNLYWDGSDFRFETKPTDRPTTWDANHVGHFYWTKTAVASYAVSYDDGATTGSDAFWCGESNKLEVGGTSGLYALTKAEWYYLLNTRTNAPALKKKGVTVDGVANCLIIAPDGYDIALQESYTLAELNTAGLVCLPPTGNRNSSRVIFDANSGQYFTASPYTPTYAERLYFSNTSGPTFDTVDRNLGLALRLVKTVE